MTQPAAYYRSKSQGNTEIATMVHRHAKSSLAKLEAEEPHRVAEILGLRQHIERLDAEYAARDAEAPPTDGGHNTVAEEPEPEMPVTADSWPAIKAHLEDLLIEARNWADGTDITNADQSSTVQRLTDDLVEGARLAEDARKVEVKPHNDALAEIQGRYNPFTAPVTNKTPGTVTKAVAALRVAQTKWLRKLDAEREAEARRLRDIADAELTKAKQALREIQQSSDIDQRDLAEAFFAEAKEIDRQAKATETAKVQAVGDGRAAGLKDSWQTYIADPVQALRWAWQAYPECMKEVALELAKAEVRAGKRTIAGFEIKNERKV